MTTKVTGSVLANTAVTAGTYGGAGSSTNHVVPVVTVDAQGRLTSAANVTITNTQVYANTGQLTANVATGVVAVGLATSGAIAGSYGSGTQTPVLTIDAYGRVTSISATTITGGSAGIGATTYNRQSNTATAGQTVFTVTGGYTVGYLQVYLNGVLLNSGDYTASNGTSFTLGVGATLGDIVESLAYTVTNVLNVSPSPSGGSAGQVLYQSAANTTANTDVGTTGYLLTSQGTGKPTWSAQSALVIANTQITGVMTASQLAATAVTPATYGGAATAAVITVDQQGRITSAANATISGGFSNMVVLTSTNASYSIPATKIKVTAVGGGGGGSGGNGGAAPDGGGGGGGGAVVQIFSGLTIGNTLNVTVGTGGIGGNYGGGGGSAGSSSSVASGTQSITTITATGGGAGSSGGGATGGLGSGGLLNIGGSGGQGGADGTNTSLGGCGGNSLFGGGGSSTSSGGGGAGRAYGGGGGGGSYTGNGGAGAAGVVIIEY